jgi:3-oxoacyl-[acyl-carrier protein] reductase
MAQTITPTGRLAGKRAIITGAGSGFGAGMAECFIAEGAHVALLDMDAEAARRQAETLGPNAHAIACDVSRADDIGQAVSEAVSAMGGLDIVVNNAGYSHPNRPMLEVSEEEFDRMFAVNVKAIYLMTNATLELLRLNGGGSILNIGSTAGIRPRPGLTWYNATKGAVNLVSKSMAVELAPDNIRVNCIAPVIGVTGMLETFMGAADTPQTRARFTATIPLGRMSSPRDIANAALYLSSDEADFITGVVMEVDGGRCI